MSKGRKKAKAPPREKTAVSGPPKGTDQFDLWGAMKGSVKVQDGWDLTQPTGEIWDAASDEPKD